MFVEIAHWLYVIFDTPQFKNLGIISLQKVNRKLNNMGKMSIDRYVIGNILQIEN